MRNACRCRAAQYHDSADGARLKHADDSIRYRAAVRARGRRWAPHTEWARAQMRAHALDAKKSMVDYDPITGARLLGLGYACALGSVAS